MGSLARSVGNCFQFEYFKRGEKSRPCFQPESLVCLCDVVRFQVACKFIRETLMVFNF